MGSLAANNVPVLLTAYQFLIVKWEIGLRRTAPRTWYAESEATMLGDMTSMIGVVFGW